MQKIFLISLVLLLYGCYLIPCDFEHELLEIENKKDTSYFSGKYSIERNINSKYDNEFAEIILNENG